MKPPDLQEDAAGIRPEISRLEPTPRYLTTSSTGT
jgi:hypothetical protein